MEGWPPNHREDSLQRRHGGQALLCPQEKEPASAVLQEPIELGSLEVVGYQQWALAPASLSLLL